MAGEEWAPRQGPSVTGAEASARPPRGRPQSRGHDGNRAGTLTARGHWHLSCRWAPEGRTAVCVWLKWTAHGRGLWGLMPSAGHHPAPQSCRRARQSGGQPLTEGCHLLAGHGDYAYQQASYSEQSYDRSFEESTQHYYEGGTERRGGVGQAAGRAQSGAEPREAALGPGPVGRPVLLLQKLELKLLPALLSLKSEPRPRPPSPVAAEPPHPGCFPGLRPWGPAPLPVGGHREQRVDTAPPGDGPRGVPQVHPGSESGGFAENVSQLVDHSSSCLADKQRLLPRRELAVQPAAGGLPAGGGPAAGGLPAAVPQPAELPGPAAGLR